MRAMPAISYLILAILFAGTSGCSDSGGPTQAATPIDLNTLPGLFVSAPVSGPPEAPRGISPLPSNNPASGDVVYVSLMPGVVPTGVRATITNQTTDVSVTTAVVDGGFDPVALAASVGDTLRVAITGGPATSSPVQLIILPHRPVRVVRTSPPAGGRDVPLNSIAVIVFSAPIDPTTLTTETVQLWRGTTAVSGAVLRSDFAGIRAEVRPDSLLTAQTEYHLVITQQIHDVNGMALDSAVTVSFTTGSTLPATGLLFAAVTAGLLHTCGVTAAGAAYCWGTNGNGELGLGNLNPAGRLTAVPVVGGLAFAAVDAGGTRTCGITADGAAYCWGENYQGELGVGTTTTFQASPAPVTGGMRFATLSVGPAHTCGVTLSGAAYCWGANIFGEIGDATTSDRSSPVLVEGGMIFTAVSPGSAHTCGITTAGNAYCWGHNAYGQLGDGTTTDRSIPGLVAGGLSFTTVSAAEHHTCGLTATGAAYCWGYNGMGQLGDGTTTDRPSPVLVAGDVSFTMLSATTAYQTCAVSAAGAAYCWGINGMGQLGDGTTTNRSSPALVAGGLNFAAVSTGYFHTCGVTVAGVTYCWGNNMNFQVGDGTGSSSSVPVKVAGQP